MEFVLYGVKSDVPLENMVRITIIFLFKLVSSLEQFSPIDNWPCIREIILWKTDSDSEKLCYGKQTLIRSNFPTEKYALIQGNFLIKNMICSRVIFL